MFFFKQLTSRGPVLLKPHIL